MDLQEFLVRKGGDLKRSVLRAKLAAIAQLTFLDKSNALAIENANYATTFDSNKPEGVSNGKLSKDLSHALNLAKFSIEGQIERGSELERRAQAFSQHSGHHSQKSAVQAKEEDGDDDDIDGCLTFSQALTQAINTKGTQTEEPSRVAEEKKDSLELLPARSTDRGESDLEKCKVSKVILDDVIFFAKFKYRQMPEHFKAKVAVTNRHLPLYLYIFEGMPSEPLNNVESHLKKVGRMKNLATQLSLHEKPQFQCPNCLKNFQCIQGFSTHKNNISLGTAVMDDDGSQQNKCKGWTDFNFNALRLGYYYLCQLGCNVIGGR